MMFKMNQLAVGLFLFLSSLFSCQQKGDFKSMNVDDFDNLIQNEDIQRLDVRTLAEYSEGHIAKTININVMDDSFASMADSFNSYPEHIQIRGYSTYQILLQCRPYHTYNI